MIHIGFKMQQKNIQEQYCGLHFKRLPMQVKILSQSKKLDENLEIVTYYFEFLIKLTMYIFCHSENNIYFTETGFFI